MSTDRFVPFTDRELVLIRRGLISVTSPTAVDLVAEIDETLAVREREDA